MSWRKHLPRVATEGTQPTRRILQLRVGFSLETGERNMSRSICTDCDGCGYVSWSHYEGCAIPASHNDGDGPPLPCEKCGGTGLVPATKVSVTPAPAPEPLPTIGSDGRPIWLYA